MQLSERSTGAIAAAHHDVDVTLAQSREHLRQQRFVVLQVGVDHRDVRGRCGKNPLHHGAGEASPADPVQAPHIRSRLRELAHGVGGAVRRIVVNEHDLPRLPVENPLEPLRQLYDVILLVESRCDD